MEPSQWDEFERADGTAPVRALSKSARQRFGAAWRRLAVAIARDGFRGFTRRRAGRLASQIAERVRVIAFSRRRFAPDAQPVFLMISHHCGGGTEQHLRHLCAQLRWEGVRPVVARPGRPGRLLWEARDEREHTLWCRETTLERRALERTLAEIRPVHAHIHHTLGIPDGLIDLLTDLRVSYDWTIHDYHAICPRINLVGASNSYCGEPDESACNRCLAQLGDDQGCLVKASIEAWRGGFGRHLGGARRVYVPSIDVRDRLERYFPDLQVFCRPHPEVLPKIESLAAAPSAGEPVRIAVVGTITAIKGSNRLLACAREALDRGLPLEFHVIGTTDKDAIFARMPNVQIGGPYRQHEVYSRLAAARCHLAFLPSLWPETYMYTLSVAMAAGLFTICFDLGAQSSRLKSWGWGRVLPLDAGPEAINDALLAAARRVASGRPAPSPPHAAHYSDMLGAYYGFSSEERARHFARPDSVQRLGGPEPHPVQRKNHARFH